MLFYDYFIILVYFTNFWCFFKYFPLMENLYDHLLLLLFIVSAREWTLWYPFTTDQTRIFSVERWRKRGLERKKWTERYLFPASVGISPLYLLWLKYFSLLCTLTWRANNFVSRQGKGINRRNEGTRGEIPNITSIISWLYWLWLVIYSKEEHGLL